MQNSDVKQPVCRSCGKPVKTAGIYLCETCSRAQGWKELPLRKVRDALRDTAKFVFFKPDKGYLEQVEKWCQEEVANRGIPVEPDKLYVTPDGYRLFKEGWLKLLEERGWTTAAIRFVVDPEQPNGETHWDMHKFRYVLDADSKEGKK